MARVLFTVSYVVPDGKRTDYLSLIAQLKAFYSRSGVEYGVFEDRSAHNHFREVFQYAAQEAFDASDDPDATAEVADVIDQVYAIVSDVAYTTSVEIG